MKQYWDIDNFLPRMSTRHWNLRLPQRHPFTDQGITWNKNSNDLMAILRPQCWLFKSVMDKQKHRTFSPSAEFEVPAPPIIARVIEEVIKISVFRWLFRNAIGFGATGRWNFGGIRIKINSRNVWTLKRNYRIKHKTVIKQELSSSWDGRPWP